MEQTDRDLKRGLSSMCFIKAILKSWQLLIDVFIWYEEECHECKNERQDLQNFIFRLISAIIPSPPIIEFPKWPDIILDLSNIRAGLTVYLPDFNISPRPIVLPTAPRLVLPDLPSANITLPELPILPRYELPEMPELPSLPSVDLPDLPPPPKIPKLFGAVEWILNIMKLVTKVMCILKTSPFVPEWRAGDQIAFLTERNGYIPTDFIDIQAPAFSYSTISAIKVSAYVNLEFDSEFIIEAVRTMLEPLDSQTSNIANMFDQKISNIDFSGAVPDDIDINIENNGNISTDISLAPLSENPKGIYLIAGMLAKKWQDMLSFMQENANETLDNDQFIQYVGTQLASETVTWDQATKELQNLWAEVRNLKYTKEDAFIADLQENSKNKFQTLVDIISTEIEYSDKQRNELKELSSPQFVTQVSEVSNESSRFWVYNSMLESYNLEALDATINLAGGESEATKSQRLEIENTAKNIQSRVSGWLANYKKNAELAAVSPQAPGNTTVWGTCNPSGTYQYTYEWIYVLEYGKNYKLFDYTDILDGSEEPAIIDIDGDKDEDILYMANGKLYFKENRKIIQEKKYFSTPPLILSANNNKFFSWEYFEALNYVSEAHVSDEAINVSFLKPSNTKISQFRMTYHTLVDRYLYSSDVYQSNQLATHIVDSFDSGIDTPIVSAGSKYKIEKNRAYLKYTWRIAGLKLTTQKLQDIWETLQDGGQVVITPRTQVYSWNSSFRIRYTFKNGEQWDVRVPAHSSIIFESSATVVWISWNAYIDMWIQEDIYGTNISSYIWKPMFADSKIVFEGNPAVLWPESHVDIESYDRSLLQLDMRNIDSYTFYDLWSSNSDTYTIRLSIPNDFYYAQLQTVKDNVLGTLSNQILLAPQKYSDRLPPQIGLNQKIRIPVYQNQSVDLTPYIYEDGGISWISQVEIDMDLMVDSDNDWNSTNDNDSDWVSVSQNASRIILNFGPFDELLNKEIQIRLTDDNGNTAAKNIPFEVYAPVPEINDIQENTILGQIDEALLWEPVRLYRFRWGQIERLQEQDSGQFIPTLEDGTYNFQSLMTASWVVLSYENAPLAEINEYTGKINLLSPLASIEVLPSNNSDNNSIYPEVVIYYANTAVFRQFMKIPSEDIQVIAQDTSISRPWSYLKIINQERFSSYRVPLWVPYNPGSISIYLTNDTNKTPIMTVFQDGRLILNEQRYRLEYRSVWENMSYVLIEKSNNSVIAELIYDIEASYIVR